MTLIALSFESVTSCYVGKTLILFWEVLDLVTFALSKLFEEQVLVRELLVLFGAQSVQVSDRLLMFRQSLMGLVHFVC